MTFIELALVVALIAGAMLFLLVLYNVYNYNKSKREADRTLKELAASLVSAPDGFIAARELEENLGSVSVAATGDDPALRLKVDKLYEIVQSRLDGPDDLEQSGTPGPDPDVGSGEVKVGTIPIVAG